ncbi:hypothetical protein JAAARDRAFT_665020 [Jaapia argillacea MUCL 33604]|uniref:Uncharacterized protein n=1 Tax=Jaapia argillacea MUCL 33604 TaxID=933084 RepID=A0A067Q4B6_9AGAM|nr:hypothetical protein JAAARDRAFT_665020 [Jaapia argillacea MUCL 33604]
MNWLWMLSSSFGHSLSYDIIAGPFSFPLSCRWRRQPPPPIVNYFLYFQVPIASAFSALALATNVVVTMMIVGRLWWIMREFDSGLGTRATKKYRKTVAMIVESGSFFSLSLLAYLITNRRAPDWGPMVLDISSQMAGIAPTLIIVRVGLGQATEQTTLNASNVMIALAPGAHSLVFAKPPTVLQSHTTDGVQAGRSWGRDNEMIRERQDGSIVSRSHGAMA